MMAAGGLQERLKRQLAARIVSTTKLQQDPANQNIHEHSLLTSKNPES
jgi:hypothetical protein